MNVFLCESIHPAALELLKSRADIVSDWADLSRVHAIINRNLKLPRSVLEQAPELKVIAVHGTGSDGIDMEYCAEHGITVLYVPYENADSVAELIVALSLTLLRKLHLADRLVQSGTPIANAPPQLFGRELAGKTLGLVGAGDIALRAARIMRDGFRVNTVGYSPSLTPERAAELGIGYCATLDDVLRQADIVNLGVHLLPTTANLISDREFSLMKPDAILINTSRGGVLDEAALYRAITENRIAGAACDVFVSEPPRKDENPLVGLDNVICTPHLGANTDEALRRVGVTMVEEIFTVLDGGTACYSYHI